MLTFCMKGHSGHSAPVLCERAHVLLIQAFFVCLVSSWARWFFVFSGEKSKHLNALEIHRAKGEAKTLKKRYAISSWGLFSEEKMDVGENPPDDPKNNPKKGMSQRCAQQQGWNSSALWWCESSVHVPPRRPRRNGRGERTLSTQLCLFYVLSYMLNTGLQWCL